LPIEYSLQKLSQIGGKVVCEKLGWLISDRSVLAIYKAFQVVLTQAVHVSKLLMVIDRNAAES